MVRGYVVSRRLVDHSRRSCSTTVRGSLLNHRPFDPRLRSMEAFYVVVLAAAVLGVGVVALMALSRMRKKMDRPDSQER